MALQPAPSTQRAIEIIKFLAQHPDDGFTVAVLARQLGQSRATCNSVLLALEAAHWVQRTDTEYRLGGGLIPIGAAAQRATVEVTLIRRFVEDLYDAARCETFGCLPTGNHLVTVARAGPSTPFSVGVAEGQVLPLAPPHGLAFATWDENELNRWIARAPQATGQTDERLRHAASLVRELGYSITLDSTTRKVLEAVVDDLPDTERAEMTRVLEYDDHATVDPEHRREMRLSYLSAPVFGGNGGVVALIGVLFGPDEQDQFCDLSAALRQVCDRFTETLIHRQPSLATSS